MNKPCPVAQSVASLIADPGVTSSITVFSYFCGDLYFLWTSLVTDNSPSLIQEGLLSVTSKSMCTEYC